MEFVGLAAEVGEYMASYHKYLNSIDHEEQSKTIQLANFQSC